MKVSTEEVSDPVSFLGLFKYADLTDKWLMLVGSIGAIGNGVSLPLIILVFGSTFTDLTSPDGTSSLLDEAKNISSKFAIVGAATFVMAFLQVACFTISSERQTFRIRAAYLGAILKQDIGWFDVCNSGSLASSIAENSVMIKDSIGEKCSQVLQHLSTVVAGYAIGFATNWKLALVICAAIPVLAISGGVLAVIQAKSTESKLAAYGGAGSIAEEALRMVKTVSSLGAENRIAVKYAERLDEAEVIGIKNALAGGLGNAFVFSAVFCSYALAFWYGTSLYVSSAGDAADLYLPNTTLPVDFVSNACSYYVNFGIAFPPELEDFCLLGPGPDNSNYPSYCKLGATVPSDLGLSCSYAFVDQSWTFNTIGDVCNCAMCSCGCNFPGLSGDCLSSGDVVTVFFAVIVASFSIGSLFPSFGVVVQGKAAARKIYSIIERVPSINQDSENESYSDMGVSLEGDIVLKDIHFHYPSRPDTKVFNGLDLTIPNGKSVALVGGSGCGKSTIVNFLLRFYDPSSGSIEINGVDIKSVPVSALRDYMGYVGQEPVLFGTTLAENIVFGMKVKPSMEIIEAAAKAANAYDFIMEFPKGFLTTVGGNSAQLSGGQKQRIAIARAIVRDPKILLLDEATSALDNESEEIVQAAIDELLSQSSRTTIVIAHRLSTVRNSDQIVVLGEHGAGVLEIGTHDELVTKENGHYLALVMAASRSQEEVEDSPGVRRAASSFVDDKRKSGIVSSPEETEDIVVESKDDVEFVKPSTMRILEFSRPEKWLYIPAIVCTMINGCSMPLAGFLLANLASLYGSIPQTSEMEQYARKYIFGFLGLAAAAAIGSLGQNYYWGIIGEKMTSRVRLALFKSTLRQEMAFFDAKENHVGALTSTLSENAALVKASVTDRTGLILMNISAAGCGLGIAFYFGWELALIMLSLIPLLVLAAAGQVIAMQGFASEGKGVMAQANSLLGESITGIRTVTAFNARENILRLYAEFLEVPNRLTKKKGLVGGLTFGFAQSFQIFTNAIAFLIGGIWISEQKYTFEQLMFVFLGVIYMAIGMGQAVAMAPDIAKGGIAIKAVFKVLDRHSAIDPVDETGCKLEDGGSGNIKLENISFSYPARPEVLVFDGFNLNVGKGKTVALVGQSGSGKSTIVGLLERFYDVNQGNVNFWGSDIKDVNVKWLRSRIGLVKQEPELFDTTIFENIAFGTDSECVTEEQVISCAKASNAHDFISAFPDGYQTMAGSQGAQLSGGQKQRIAIARALIRSPDILLLDEATSALDNESEKLVQAALDELLKSKSFTCIVIAHRLSTIQHADKIVVVDHGKVVEMGSHTELLALNGTYSKLFEAQRLI